VRRHAGGRVQQKVGLSSRSIGADSYYGVPEV
jgi:hypothetical protein